MKIVQTSHTEWKDTEKDIVFEFPNLPDMSLQKAEEVIRTYIDKQVEICLQQRIYNKKHHTVA